MSFLACKTDILYLFPVVLLQFYVNTIKLMAQRQFASGSPLRTLCLLIAGQPADVFSADTTIYPGPSGGVNMSQPAQVIIYLIKFQRKGDAPFFWPCELEYAAFSTEDLRRFTFLVDCCVGPLNSFWKSPFKTWVAHLNLKFGTHLLQKCITGTKHL